MIDFNLEYFINKGAHINELPLTEEGRRRMPCHPISEMDIPLILAMVKSSNCGIFRAQSEDEVCDLGEYLAKGELNKKYLFYPISDFRNDQHYLGYEINIAHHHPEQNTSLP